MCVQTAIFNETFSPIMDCVWILQWSWFKKVHYRTVASVIDVVCHLSDSLKFNRNIVTPNSTVLLTKYSLIYHEHYDIEITKSFYFFTMSMPFSRNFKEVFRIPFSKTTSRGLGCRGGLKLHGSQGQADVTNFSIFINAALTPRLRRTCISPSTLKTLALQCSTQYRGCDKYFIFYEFMHRLLKFIALYSVRKMGDLFLFLFLYCP